MALADKTWRRISIHDMVLEWLRSERHNELVNHSWPDTPAVIDRLIDRPDLSHAGENRARLRLWYLLRLPLIVEFPPDIAWYVVESLTDRELDELHVVQAPGWIGARGESALRAVSAWKRIPLAKSPSIWPPPILFGHGKAGPFSILEGNHRLTAYAASGMTGIDIPVIIGLSPLGCYWHAPSAEPQTMLVRDRIWRNA